jgi:hypothetical protein
MPPDRKHRRLLWMLFRGKNCCLFQKSYKIHKSTLWAKFQLLYVIEVYLYIAVMVDNCHKQLNHSYPWQNNLKYATSWSHWPGPLPTASKPASGNCALPRLHMHIIQFVPDIALPHNLHMHTIRSVGSCSASVRLTNQSDLIVYIILGILTFT